MAKLLLYVLCLLIELVGPTTRGPIPAAKNLYRIMLEHEHWSSLLLMEAEPSIHLSDEWMHQDDRSTMLIAHALGNYDFPNTLDGARESVQAGIRLLEVDVFIDGQGRLRCHHGPSEPLPYEKQDCTLDKLVGNIPDNVFVIIDAKSDFFEVSRLVLGLAANTNSNSFAKKIIFQLYKPSHVTWFFMTAAKRPELLRNMPIITLYRTHAAAPLVSRVAPPGVGAIAYPFSKRNQNRASLEYYLLGINHKTLVHPVRECSVYQMPGGFFADGLYGPSSLLGCLSSEKISSRLPLAAHVQ